MAKMRKLIDALIPKQYGILQYFISLAARRQRRHEVKSFIDT